MNFTYHYLGFLSGGKIIKVQLNQQAHVALLNTVNLNRYTHKQSYRHYGELQTYMQDKYKLPFYDEWHVIIYCNTPLKSLVNVQ